MRLFFTLTIITLLLSSCASQKPGPDIRSGFLSWKNYDLLAKVEVPSDQIVFRYLNPEFKSSDYHHVIVDPVVAYPKPQPTEQVSMKTLLTLQAKLTSFFEDSFSQFLPLAQSPGPGVLRFQVAITGINISGEPLKFYEYIPIGLAAAGTSTALGTRDQEVKLFLEGRLVDSDSNEIVGIGIREISGDDLENVREKLKAQDLNQGLSSAGKDLTLILQELFSR